MAHEFLTTYLNDHIAGSQMALEILDLLHHLDNAAVWQDMKSEIDADRQELEQLIRSINSTPSALRRAAAWMVEKFAELKMRVDDPSTDAALRRLELIEALAIGIDGKHALWTALQMASQITPELKSLDYERLIARAEAQRGVVEVRRLQAAADALGAAPRTPSGSAID
jgi:uncharacterized protein with HEPN domain